MKEIIKYSRQVPSYLRKDYENYLKGYKCKYAYNKTFVYHWRQRLINQCYASDNTFWLTLTFDETNIFRPYTREELSSIGLSSFSEACSLRGVVLVDNHDNDDVLRRAYYNRCFDLFIRRLRITLERRMPLEERHNIAKFKFYFTTETGDLFGRFHLHGFIWNKPTCISNEDFQQIIHDTWKYGFISFEEMFSYAKKVNYCTKYLFKRFEDKDMFSRKSNSIGLCYWNDERKRHQLSSMTTTFHCDGREYHMGRFYCDKVFGKPGTPVREQLKKKQQDVYSVMIYESTIEWFKDHPSHPCFVHLKDCDIKALPLDYVQSVMLNHDYCVMMHKGFNEKREYDFNRERRITEKLNDLRFKYLELYNKRI